jgi:hypothetical protein
MTRNSWRSVRGWNHAEQRSLSENGSVSGSFLAIFRALFRALFRTLFTILFWPFIWLRGLFRTHDSDAARSTLQENPIRTNSTEDKAKIFGLGEVVDRDEKRRRILEYLLDAKQEEDEAKIKKLDPAEQSRVLLSLADEYQGRKHFYFNKFEQLCILNILHKQHNLMELDEEIEHKLNGEVSGEISKRLGEEIVEYGDFNWSMPLILF